MLKSLKKELNTYCRTKNIISKIKNTLDGYNNGLDLAEAKISKLEDKIIEKCKLMCTV